MMKPLIFNWLWKNVVKEVCISPAQWKLLQIEFKLIHDTDSFFFYTMNYKKAQTSIPITCKGNKQIFMKNVPSIWHLLVLARAESKSRDLWRYTSHFFHCRLSQNKFCWSLFSRQGSNNIWCDFLETALPNQRKKTTELHWLHCKKYWAWDSRHANNYVGQRYLAWHCVLYLGCVRQVVVVAAVVLH